jgi:cob(I)alamin adenosyltransferase
MRTGKNKDASTKTGDDGYTDMIGERRLPKDHPLLECLGSIDELNAFLGDAKAALQNRFTQEIITKIQKDLCSIMGILAGMPIPAEGIGTDYLDMMISELESEMPATSSFAIPGETPTSSKLHISRTVCRRVERRLVSLDLEAEAKTTIIPYINRLSNLLFLLACKESANTL